MLEEKLSQKKVIPVAFSILTFSLVCIFLHNGGWYPNYLKFVMYIRITLFTRPINFFPTTYIIDIVLHASFGERKCCQFSTGLKKQ